MPSPETSDRKRAQPPRASDHTKEFLKDWKRLTHSGRYNMQQLKQVMVLLIANDAPLPALRLFHVTCFKHEVSVGDRVQLFRKTLGTVDGETKRNRYATTETP